MKDDKSRTDILEEAIAAIKADAPSAADLIQARERARAALTSHRAPQGVVMKDLSPAPPAKTSENWDSIDDYIAAIPAYFAKELDSQQTMLFEEESRQSIPLRRALNEARGINSSHSESLGDEPKASRLRWFASAATVAAIAIALFITLPDLPSFNQTSLAQVDEIDGQLYQLVDGHLQALTPGSWINGRQRIRSAGGSSALITLDDGSQIEVDERSELSMTRRSSGNRIDVSRGRILVAASPQGSGTLDVFTDEFMVSVTGTIFEVAHGAKGSRVAVIEGSVNVLLQGDTTSVKPGQIMDSRVKPYIESFALSVADEIAWSQDADLYIAMVQEVAALQQDLAAVLDTQPRYSTRLLDLVPENTALYVAVPNAPEKVAQVYEVIRARLQGNELLGESWAEFESDSQAQYLDEVMSWLGQIGSTLGDETVFVLSETKDQQDKNNMVPIVLSEVDADAFRAAFDDQVQRLTDVLAAEDLETDFEVVLINDPADAAPNQLSILLIDDLLVASISPESLQNMQAIIANGRSAFVDTKLHKLLQTSYDQGTGLVGAVDISQLFSSPETSAELSEGLTQAGLHNAEYLIAQHQQQNGNTTITADLFFSGQREGAMAWLGNPGPMGSLEFFSTDTTFAAAMLIKEPLAIAEGFGAIELPEGIDAQAELELFYNIIGILGGEFAFGLDGPALPTPAWKAVIEAFDETNLQENIEWSAARFNEYAVTEGLDSSIELIPNEVAGYSGYSVRLNGDINLGGDSGGKIDFGFESVSFHYAYVDGYLVAGPNEALIDRAIGFYESGSGLQTDSEFRELLSRDGYLDFSAVFFNRLGELFNDVMKTLPAELSPEQEAVIASLDSEISASMTSLLALPDAIHFAHSGSAQMPTQILSQLITLQPLLGSFATLNDAVN
jgi:hypothetical protein